MLFCFFLYKHFKKLNFLFFIANRFSNNHKYRLDVIPSPLPWNEARWVKQDSQTRQGPVRAIVWVASLKPLAILFFLSTDSAWLVSFPPVLSFSAVSFRLVEDEVLVRPGSPSSGTSTHFDLFIDFFLMDLLDPPAESSSSDVSSKTVQISKTNSTFFFYSR